MDPYWIVVGSIGWALGLLFLFALMRIAGGEDRAVRRLERQLFPESNVDLTITPAASAHWMPLATDSRVGLQ